MLRLSTPSSILDPASAQTDEASPISVVPDVSFCRPWFNFNAYTYSTCFQPIQTRDVYTTTASRQRIDAFDQRCSCLHRIQPISLMTEVRRSTCQSPVTSLITMRRLTSNLAAILEPIYHRIIPFRWPPASKLGTFGRSTKRNLAS